MDGACGNIRKHIELQDINSNQTFQVETVVFLSNKKVDGNVKFDLGVEEV